MAAVDGVSMTMVTEEGVAGESRSPVSEIWYPGLLLNFQIGSQGGRSSRQLREDVFIETLQLC